MWELSEQKTPHVKAAAMTVQTLPRKRPESAVAALSHHRMKNAPASAYASGAQLLRRTPAAIPAAKLTDSSSNPYPSSIFSKKWLQNVHFMRKY
jgi:hypothetical protein